MVGGDDDGAIDRVMPVSTANTLIDDAMSRRYEEGFQPALMVKDLRIASSLFERVGFEAPISQLLRDQFDQALAQLDDQRPDLSRSLEHWERRGGVRVPPPLHVSCEAFKFPLAGNAPRERRADQTARGWVDREADESACGRRSIGVDAR
jgi:hypothetical protein